LFVYLLSLSDLPPPSSPCLITTDEVDESSPPIYDPENLEKCLAFTGLCLSVYRTTSLSDKSVVTWPIHWSHDTATGPMTHTLVTWHGRWSHDTYIGHMTQPLVTWHIHWSH